MSTLNFMAILDQAMRRRGLPVPTTPAEVSAAEDRLEAEWYERKELLGLTDQPKTKREAVHG